MRAILFIALFALATVTRGEELVITSPGKYTAKEGKISLDFAVADQSHLKFRVEWEVAMAGGGSMQFVEAFEEPPFPVAAGQWAFCLVGKDELWLYAGDGLFYRYKGTGDGLTSSASCDDLKLGERAPTALKKWIEEKSRKKR